MSQTLYRKYRPQTFKEVAGQQPIIATLTNEIKNNRVTHAYLFTGPRGVGKTTTARLLAKAVNCEKRKDEEPCNICQSCQDIIKNRSLDIIEIDAASHTQVDHVRESIIPNARTAPTRNKFKVFIIDEVHMLSISAFNALLKILEEPPAHVIFILATTEVHKLPETIISRCQRFDFKRVAVKEIIERLAKISQLEKIKTDKKVLQQIAVMSDGSIRDAEGVLGQVFSLGEKNITVAVADLVLPRSDYKLIISLFECLINKKTGEGIELVNKLVEEGVDLKYFIDQFIEFLRKVALLKIDENLDTFSYFEVTAEEKDEFIDLLEKVDLESLPVLIDAFIKCRREILLSPVPQLPLELIVIEFTAGQTPKGRQFPPLKPDPKVSHSGPKNQPQKKDTEKAVNIQDNLVGMKAKWPGIIKSLNENNHSLALILKNCQPVDFSEGTLSIGCSFKFHSERLNEKKNFDKIKEVISRALGEKIKIRFIIKKLGVAPPEVEKQGGGEETKTDLYSEVVQAFGGKVVES